jgi:hypothetical protein
VGEGGFKLTDTLNGFWRNDLSQHLFSWSAGVILLGAMREHGTEKNPIANPDQLS